MKRRFLRTRLPLIPPDATVLSEELAIVRKEDEIVFWNGSGPIFSCSQDDQIAVRVASAMFAELGMVKPGTIADELGIHRSTVHRNRRKLRAGGVAELEERKAVQPARRLTDERRAAAQRLLDERRSNRDVARAVDVSEGTIRQAIRAGRLSKPPTVEESSSKETASPVMSEVNAPIDALVRPSVRSEIDRSADGGVAVKRHEDRVLARIGLLAEAAPEFQPAEAVPGAGVYVALSALLEQGLVEVGEQIFGSLRNGYFGLRSVLLTVAFMALLRIRSPEQLTSFAPGELGILLGLDRAPEVKTLRRKLREMGERGLATSFSEMLARRWAQQEPDELGFLYIDGHVQPYNGRTHKLPKAWVPRRRLAMPASTNVWVNDQKGDPVFFVMSPANEGLLTIIDNHVLPEIRELVGADRRVTLVFDREGWSPKRFWAWSSKGFDVLTYRKGKYAPWPEDSFTEVKLLRDGKLVPYQLAEQETTLSKGFVVREVRRLCDNGHQTSVITTRRDLSIEEVAQRMFARWVQENFFRYMRHEFALDHVCTYAVEELEPGRLLPNPERRKKKKELVKLKRELVDLERQYGDLALENREGQRRTMRGFKIANADLGRRIQELRDQCAAIDAAFKALPKRVPIHEIEGDLVKLEQERKRLVDGIKMIAYRAETSLANALAPFFPRHDDEARKFLKTVFAMPADLIPDETNGELIIALHGMSNPRSNETLDALCELLAMNPVSFPGTNLRVVVRGPGQASHLELRVGQEP
jgi:hypothetical protein